MAGFRIDEPFIPIQSSETSFFVTLSTVSSAHTLESTGARIWSGPSGRTIRLAESSGNEYYIAFGSASTTTVATTTGSMMMLGGVVEAIKVQPSNTHIAFITNSTSPSNVCVTLGYGR